jgi:hypothetical protein
MWEDSRIRLAMSLADQRGKFLYEILPDFIHYGFLTDLEMELWGKYLAWKKNLLDEKTK